MPVDKLTVQNEDGTEFTMWRVYGDGLEALLTESQYKELRAEADKLKEQERRKKLGHPLFNGEVGIWNGITMLETPRYLLVNPVAYRMLKGQPPLRTWTPRYRTATPWRHRNGDIIGQAAVHDRPTWHVSRHRQIRIAMGAMLHGYIPPMAWQIITNGPPHARP